MGGNRRYSATARVMSVELTILRSTSRRSNRCLDDSASSSATFSASGSTMPCRSNTSLSVAGE